MQCLAIVFTAPGLWLTHRVSQSTKRVFRFCYFFSVIFTLFSNCLMLTCGVGNLIQPFWWFQRNGQMQLDYWLRTLESRGPVPFENCASPDNPVTVPILSLTKILTLQCHNAVFLQKVDDVRSLPTPCDIDCKESKFTTVFIYSCEYLTFSLRWAKKHRKIWSRHAKQN